jgi:hypothetical protein
MVYLINFDVFAATVEQAGKPVYLRNQTGFPACSTNTKQQAFLPVPQIPKNGVRHPTRKNITFA